MPPELTPEEMSFFETGELPANLASQHEQAAAAAEQAQADADAAAALLAAAPKDEVIVPPADAPSALERLLTEERERRTALETSLNDIRAQLAERLKTPEVKEEVPDSITDPLGHMMHQLKTVNETVNKLQTEITARQQADSQRMALEQFKAAVDSAKATFEATTPDFMDAYKHVRALRADDLRLSGCPEADINKILVQDEFQIAQTALQRGKNPAEEMYNMAKRYGYVPKPATSSQQAPKAGLTAEEKVAALAKGGAAAKQPAKGAPDAGVELTAAGLKDVSNSDLNKLVADDKMWAKIVGGASGEDIFPH